MNRIDCTLINGAAMTSDLYTDWVDTRGMSEIAFHISSNNTGSPNGAWTVEVSNDPRCRVELDHEPKVTGADSTAKKVDITANIDPVHGTGFTVNAANDTFFALTGGLPRYVRLKYTRSSGGTGSACFVYSAGRS